MWTESTIVSGNLKVCITIVTSKINYLKNTDTQFFSSAGVLKFEELSILIIYLPICIIKSAD